MPDDSNTTKIGFSAIIFWDYVYESDEEELLKSLTNMYGDEPQEHSGPYIGGGGWHHKVAGNETNEIEQDEQFASVRTLVQYESDGILDVTTFAVLSEEQIRHVLNSENRTGLRELHGTLTEYVENLPTLNDHDQTGHKGVYYSEWSGKQSLIPSDSELAENEVMDRLSEEHQTLFSFGFQTGGILSLVEGNILVSPTTTMEPFDGIAGIRKNSHPQAKPMEELITPPPWYSEVSGLKRYYRLHVWVNSRWRRLHEFDDLTNEAREALSSLSPEETDVQEILSVSERIQALQSEYTEFRTRYDAEYQSLQNQFRERSDEQTTTFGIPYDIPLPRRKEPDMVERTEDQTNSLVTYFEDSSERAFEQVDSLYNRITEKIESLVSAIESRTQLAATDENIRLQKRITWLTWGLTVLTLVLVGLTILLIVIELL